MKNPSFILKNKYQEHYLLEEYESHRRRIKSLEPSETALKEEIKKNVEFSELRMRNLEFTRNHRKKLQTDIEQQENEKMVERLANIYFSESKLPQRPKSKKKKQEKRLKTQEDEYNSRKQLHPEKTGFLTDDMLLPHMQRKRENQQKEINEQNEFLAYRLMNLQPLVYRKQRLDHSFYDQKQLSKRIRKFHILKPRNVYNPEDEYGDDNMIDEKLFDTSNPDLLKERIHLYLKLVKFQVSALYKNDKGDEKYFFQIMGREGMRRTQPEFMKDFHKSVINEYFTFNDLRDNKHIQISVYVQKKKDEDTFIGEFEIDLAPYFLESGIYKLKFKLTDKLTKKTPHYMLSGFEQRTRGSIEFKLRIQSNIKKYLFDQSPEGVNHYYQARKSIRVPGAGGARGSVRGSITYRPSISNPQNIPIIGQKSETAIYHARLSRIPDNLRIQENVKSKTGIPRARSSMIKK